jgi:hypothetical protein
MVKKFINKNESNLVVVVGKIYWEQCGACIALKPEWIKMKKYIRKLSKNNSNVSYVFNEIKSGDTEQTLINKINEKYLSNSENKLAIQGGYPTLFKIKDNILSYFEGSRTLDNLIKFYVDDKSGGNNKENESRMKVMTKSLDIAEKMSLNNNVNEKNKTNTGFFNKLRSLFGGNRTRKRRSDKKQKTQKKE